MKVIGMTETHYAILRYVANHRNTGSSAIVAEFGMDPRSVLRQLLAASFIDGEMRDGAMAYWTTVSGNQLVSDGEVAGPRQPVTGGSYTGERSGYIRTTQSPPSRRGDELLPYTRPMIIASKVQVMKGTSL